MRSGPRCEGRWTWAVWAAVWPVWAIWGAVSRGGRSDRRLWRVVGVTGGGIVIPRVCVRGMGGTMMNAATEMWSRPSERIAGGLGARSDDSMGAPRSDGPGGQGTGTDRSTSRRRRGRPSGGGVRVRARARAAAYPCSRGRYMLCNRGRRRSSRTGEQAIRGDD